MEALSLEQACFIIAKAREFDVKVEPVIDDPASNPADDRDVSTLSDYDDEADGQDDYDADSTEQELSETLQSLNVDAMTELLALLWLGRGDAADWNDAMTQARDTADENAVRYLIGTPMLGDLLEDGLSELGLSCEEAWEGRL